MTSTELLDLIDQAAAEGWTELDLSGQGLTELPKEIGKLTQLKTLILGKVDEWKWGNDEYTPQLVTNELRSLPDELTALENLQSLDLSGNPLQTIPDCVFQLQGLESLRLTAVGLTAIPEAIAI